MRLRSPALVLLLAALFAFYLWTAATGWRSLAPGRELGRVGARDFAGFHNLLTEAFLAGQLHLTIPPDPRLLALPDPYDPSASAPYRLSEASLYHGKYYFYWGPTPVLLLFLPFRLLTGLYLPESLAGLLFCSGAFLCAAATLILFQRALFPALPPRMLLAALAALGLSIAGPFLLRRPAVCEVSVASAWCFAAAAVFCFARASFSASARLRCWLLGSLCLGLAVGARPPFLVWAVALVALAAPSLRAAASRRLSLACLLGPFALCLALLGIYNYLRFNSLTEFGYRYLVTGPEHMPTYKIFDPARVPFGLYYFFLEPHSLSFEFPFWRLHTPPPHRFPAQYYPQLIAGCLLAFPFLNVLWGFPVLRTALRRSRPDLARLLSALLLAALLSALLVSALTPPNVDYLLYFLGLLFLAASLFWFFLDEHLRSRPRWRLFQRLVVGALISYGLLFGVFSSFTSHDQSLERYHLAAWRTLQSAFFPVERLAAVLLRPSYGPLGLRLQLEVAPPGATAPLVVTGDQAAADIVFFRYLPSNRIVFGFDHWGRPASFSEPVQVDLGRPLDLELHMGSLYPASPRLFGFLFPGLPYDRLKTLFLLKLDGREVLRDQCGFYFSAPAQVSIGRNPTSGTAAGNFFPGRLLEAHRLAPPRLQ